MTRAAWRGVGVLLLIAGTVLGLLAAGRLAPGAAGGAWQSRPLWPLCGAAVTLLLLAVALLRRHGPAEAGAGDDRRDTAALLRDLDDAVLALQAGRRSPSTESGPLPVALEALAEAPAPADEAAYLLWLKLQLDPVLEELLPQLFASREAYRKRRGVVAYGVLFTGLARAERLLGRAWSAAVDGYEAEARKALADAAAQVEESAAELGRQDAAEAAGPRRAEG